MPLLADDLSQLAAIVQMRDVLASSVVLAVKAPWECVRRECSRHACTATVITCRTGYFRLHLSHHGTSIVWGRAEPSSPLSGCWSGSLKLVVEGGTKLCQTPSLQLPKVP